MTQINLYQKCLKQLVIGGRKGYNISRGPAPPLNETHSELLSLCALYLAHHMLVHNLLTVSSTRTKDNAMRLYTLQSEVLRRNIRRALSYSDLSQLFAIVISVSQQQVNKSNDNNVPHHLVVCAVASPKPPSPLWRRGGDSDTHKDEYICEL